MCATSVAERQVRFAVAILVAVLVATACSQRGPEAYDDVLPSPAQDEDGADTDEDTEDADEPESEDGLDLDERDDTYLFDQSKLHTFDIELSEADLAILDADPVAEEYVPGTLRFENETIAVGVRYKGSIGAFVGCVDGPELFDPSGAKTCTKLSLKVKINWDDPDTEFLGVRKLQFHSMNLDPSLFHERLGYWLMGEMGVAAPRSTHARVLVNGEFVGVFALTENLDGRFTRAHFDDGSGNFYKEVWPFTPNGGLTDEDMFIAGLRTNEDDPNTNALIIRRFAADLLGADNPADTIENWMDIESTMNHLAVDRTIRHDDGPFHFYCSSTRVDGCSNHNFFFYENPSSSQITMVPWDLDNAFSNVVKDANPVTPVPDGFGEIQNDCKPFSYGSFALQQRSAACDPLFAAWATMDDEFAAAVDRLHDGPLRAEIIDPLLDQWEEQIKDAVAEAATMHSDAIDLDDWAEAVEKLRWELEHARNNPAA